MFSRGTRFWKPWFVVTGMRLMAVTPIVALVVSSTDPGGINFRPAVSIPWTVIDSRDASR